MTADAPCYYTMRTFAAPVQRPAAAGSHTPMLTGIRDAVLIYNPTSGRRRALRQDLLEMARRSLSASGGMDVELQATAGPGHATELARRAVAQNRQLVILSGGDGTLNEAVNGLAGSKVPLALLPSGTANVLGKELALPWDIPRAAALIPSSTLRRIALGLAVCPSSSQPPRYFICIGGAGPDGAMIYNVDVETKRSLGILAYWLEGAKMAATYRFPAFRVTSPELSLDAAVLVVGRTKHYGGPVQITTRASLFDNSFEVMAAMRLSRWRQLAQFPAVFTGRMRERKDVYFWKTSSVRVEPLPGSGKIYAQVDGECIGAIPVEFSIVPDALTLAVPSCANLAPPAWTSGGGG